MKLDKTHPLYKGDLIRILETDGIEKIQGKSFLITGATGMLGTHLIDALMLLNKNKGNIKVYAVGRSQEKAFERLGEYYGNCNFNFITQDVRDPLPKDLTVDYIIPLASNTHPLAYSEFPIETIEINVKGTEHALNKAIECDATLIYPSTVEIYGNARTNDDFKEDYTGMLDLSTSRSCYTESKRLSEALCQSYISERNAKVKIVRLSRIFGPTMLMNDSKASSQFIKKALVGENIVLKSKGEQYFSYTYVSDAVSAILHVLSNGKNGEAYNISNDVCNAHIKDFAEECAAIAHTEVVLDLPSDKEKQGYSIASRAILDNSKILATGWHPKYTLRDSIARTITILK